MQWVGLVDLIDCSEHLCLWNEVRFFWRVEEVHVESFGSSLQILIMHIFTNLSPRFIHNFIESSSQFKEQSAVGLTIEHKIGIFLIIMERSLLMATRVVVELGGGAKFEHTLIF